MTQQSTEAKTSHTNFYRQPHRQFSVSRLDDTNVAAKFSFQDNKWFLLDILRPHEANHEGTISFAGISEWLLHDAKLYVARLWLTSAVGAINIQQVMVSLRDLCKLLPEYTGKPMNLTPQHAKEFVRRYCALGHSAISNQGVRRRLNEFFKFLRQRYPDNTRHALKLVFPKDKTHNPAPQPFEQSQAKRVPAEVLAAIIDACTADTKAYEEAKRNYIDRAESPEKEREYQRLMARGRRERKKAGLTDKPAWVLRLIHLHGRAIKAQALILAICVGRRAAAICNTQFNVRTERKKWTNEAGQEESGVSVRFREKKIRNVDEDVFCPDGFGELALQAIEKAKELTRELRNLNPQWKDYLFLAPTRRKNEANVISVRQLNDYLHGQNKYFPGLCQRYGITTTRITIHNFRATRATNAWTGGLQVHEVSQDLGHVNSDMALRHYIIGGDETRRRFQSYMDTGALSGSLENLMGGQALAPIRLSKRHVGIAKNQGMVVSVTRYGACILPASSGPCIRTTPCYIGPGGGPEGCDYHLLTPDALPGLEEDKEVLLESIATYGDDPEYRMWVHHEKIQLGVVGRKIREAKTFSHRAEGRCPSDDSCNCAN
jgi:site-specific recombinase XerD